MDTDQIEGRTYRQEWVNCIKAGCQRCENHGRGHGPYWYAYWREHGRVRSEYIGKTSPEYEPQDHSADPPDAYINIVSAGNRILVLSIDAGRIVEQFACSPEQLVDMLTRWKHLPFVTNDRGEITAVLTNAGYYLIP